MRRLLMFCLLVMLPFQGVASAVAGITALGAPCAGSWQVAGHGAGLHAADAQVQLPADLSADLPAGVPGDGAAAASGPTADCDEAPAQPCCGTGCSSCHGHGLVAMISEPVMIGACTGGSVVTRSAGGAPDHIPEHPLRPPLSSAT